MPRKSARATSGSASGGIQFIEMNTPADGSWKKTARSYAAQRYYVNAREEHVRQHTARALKRDRGSQRQIVGTTTHQSHLPSQARCLVPGSRVWRINETKTDPSDRKDRFKINPEMLLQIRGVDPLNTLARPTSRFESYLFDHYVKHVALKANTCEHTSKKMQVLTGDGTHRVELAAADDGLLNAIFLSSCRSLVELSASGPYYENALKYKGACIRSINHTISQQGPSPTTATMATALALAADSFIAGDILAAEQHCNAAGVMIWMKGGPQGVRGEELLRRTVQWATLKPPQQGREIWRALEDILLEMQ